MKFTPFQLILGLTSLTTLSSVQAQLFTVQVGQAPASSMSLVRHTNDWHYRRGTNAPPADWRTAADASLDSSWSIGPGGLGYGDGDDTTLISDMRSNFVTISIRQSFTIASPVNPNQHLRLTVDYDDGFIAYLDGVEIARSPNVPGAPDTLHPFNQGLATVHEARGYQGLSVDVFDAGPVGNRLAPGTHILAVQGINDDLNSSDLSLTVDLDLAGVATTQISGPLLSIVFSNAVALAGSNTFPGSARVLVDGAEATFDPGQSTWSHTASLRPGYNRLLLQAVDGAGVPLFSTNQVIISELASTSVGGAVDGNTVWDSSMGVIHATNTVLVRSNAMLTLNPGTVVLLNPGAYLRTTEAGRIHVNGAETNLVCLGPADGGTVWGQILVEGSNSSLTLRHAEVIAGAVQGGVGSTCLLEDSYVHDYKVGSTPIAGCTNGASMIVRGCHFSVYHETLWRGTPILIEESLFEYANNPSSDALDFDGVPPGSTIRRCTFRHGPNSNTDAVDIGPGLGKQSIGVIIEDSLMFDFPTDKGVSIGEGSYGIVVRNCLMYGNDSGVAVKDSPGTPPQPPCTAIIYDCTIVNCDYGFRCFNKSNPNSPTDGGQVTNSYNNIIWNSRFATFEILNSGFVVADHSDLGATNWPGAGNFDADPLFLNPAQRDYRLATNSPCIGTGRDGATLGAQFPVGAAMALSHPRIESIVQDGTHDIVRFWVDSEKTYTLQRSDVVTGGNWVKVSDFYPHPLPRKVAVTNELSGHSLRFYRLVTPRVP